MLAFEIDREGLPCACAEGEAGTVGVFGVADGDGVVGGGDFDAVAAVA